MNELSPEARALMENAREGVPPPSARSRATMRWALLSSMAPAVAAASFGKMLFVGVVSAAVGAGVTAVTIQSNRPPAPARNMVSVSSPKAPPAVVASPVPVGEAPAAAPDPVVVVPAPIVRAPPTRKPVATPTEERVVVTAPPEPVVDDSMAAELEAVSGILSSVEGERWNEAADALVRFRARFTQPALRVETEVLEVRILCGQGDVVGAEQRASALRASHPRNPSVQRLASPPCGR